MRTQSCLSTQEVLAPARETRKTVVFVGNARLPQSLAPSDSSSVISIELEVEMSSGAITGISVRGALPLGAKLIEEVLAGRRIQDGPDDVVGEAKRRYVCPSCKALCAAVINAYEAHQRYCQQRAPSL
jgi:hypothetical protein